MKQPAMDIGKLSPSERLQLIESLWDSLSEQPDAVPLTDAQRNELDHRIDALECDGGGGIPWEEVLKPLRQGQR